MRISDWSSDVCSSDLAGCRAAVIGDAEAIVCVHLHRSACTGRNHASGGPSIGADRDISCKICRLVRGIGKLDARYTASAAIDRKRSEEHTSELQSLMRNSYAVFCLKKKKNKHIIKTH